MMDSPFIIMTYGGRILKIPEQAETAVDPRTARQCEAMCGEV